MASPSPTLGVRNPNPKLQSLLSQERRTNCKFCRYIHTHRVHPNKSPLKFGRKGSVGVSRDCPNFLSTPIISRTGKATNFKFCKHIHRIDRNKSPLKISASSRGRTQGLSKIFNRAHRAVIFEVAQLSCLSCTYTPILHPLHAKFAY